MKLSDAELAAVVPLNEKGERCARRRAARWRGGAVAQRSREATEVGEESEEN